MTATAKHARWGRSRSNPAKIYEKSEVEKARSEEPLRRAPMLMSGSVDLRHSPEKSKNAGTPQAKGRASVRDMMVAGVAHQGNAGIVPAVSRWRLVAVSTFNVGGIGEAGVKIFRKMW